MSTISLENAAALLGSALQLGGWRNDQLAIVESFPHLATELTLVDIVGVVESLNVPYRLDHLRETEITDGHLPALMFPSLGDACIIVGTRERSLSVRMFLPQSGTIGERKARAAQDKPCTLITIGRDREVEYSKTSTVDTAFSPMLSYLPWLLVASLLSNLLGLIAPLLIMAIYDWVIPAATPGLLLALAIGVAIAALSDFALRHARTIVLAYVGSRGEEALALALFRKLLSIPPNRLKGSDSAQLVVRFRQLEALRDVFTGQVTTTVLDLPFTLITLCVLVYIAPPVGVMTLIVAIIFLVFSTLSSLRQARLDRVAIETAQASQATYRDAIVHQRAMADLGLYEPWSKRSARLSDRAEEAQHEARSFQNLAQTLNQGILALATAGTILLGTAAAIDGTMSFGALIATIVLVSKVLAPIHGLHYSLPQILSFLQSRKQTDRVFAMPGEMELSLQRSLHPTLGGAISFDGVTHRPDQGTKPLLSQASFQIVPGELVVIMSNNTSARTSILDIIDGLEMPLAGSVNHDDIDIRQIAPGELRRSISYSHNTSSFFHGSILQNLRLSAPEHSVIERERVLGLLSVDDILAGLPDGLDTRLTDGVLSELPPAALKGLNLARAMLRPASVYLFAEPTVALGSAQREGVRAWLSENRGKATIVVTTADRSLIPMADRVMFFNGPRLMVNGSDETAVKKLEAALKNIGG